MDIFKLLARSTKLGTRNAPQQKEKLPSSGQDANPQLFGGHGLSQQGSDSETAVKSRKNGSLALGKRKRTVGATADVPQDLDFFGAGNAKEKKVVGSPQPNTQARQKESNHVEFKMSDAERKALLKRHKIKVTVLAEPASPSAKGARNGIEKRSIKSANGRDGLASDELVKQDAGLEFEPLASFSQLRPRYNMSKQLAAHIAQQGYRIPTEVQLAALPLLMEEKISTLGAEGIDRRCNLLSVAPTGSGKTLAFLIPVIDSLLRRKKFGDYDGTQAIILVPTRELAHQIVNEGKKLAQNTGIRVTLMRKGMVIDTGHDDLVSADEASSDASSDNDGKGSAIVTTRVKSHIIVSTPLVLRNSLDFKGSSAILSRIQHLILDEADVLLDRLFLDQVHEIWSACSSPDLRVTLWSATLPSSIEEIIQDHLRFSRRPLVRLVVGIKDSAIPNVTHTLTYTGSEGGKLLAIRQLLHPTATDTDSEGHKSLRPPFLVFTQTIERARALQAELRYDIPPEAGGSARMAALHSEMSESAREKIMRDFRNGEIWVIITTDLLARGIDFRGLNGVVNYDVPTSAAAYVHRVGRTGRAGREGGVAITFYTKDDIPYVKTVANVIAASEKLRGKDAGESSTQDWLLNALPTPSKKDKKELKNRGVEARRKGNKSAMITTKSGYERKLVARKRDMSGRRQEKRPRKAVDDDAFLGFSD